MSLTPDTGSVELKSYSAYTLQQLLEKHQRSDGRAFDEIRVPHVARELPAAAPHNNNNNNDHRTSVSTSGTAEQEGTLVSTIYTDDSGACLHCVVSGVFGPPDPQAPTEGRLHLHLSAPLLLSREYTSQAGGLASSQEDLPLRQVEGYVREVLASCFDLRPLLVKEGEACWVLSVHMTCLLADGGLRAAALHATLAALEGLVLPRTRLPSGDVVEPILLRLTRVPVACTYGVIGGTAAGTQKLQLLADTSAIEEYVADGTITVAVDEANNLVNLQYVSPTPLLPSVLVACAQQWQGKAAAVRAAILKSYMDAAEADLHCYHLARQLQLVPELHNVFHTNAMPYPMFYYCLDSKAKTEVKHILLCLQRWLITHYAKAQQALSASAGANPEGLAERIAAMEFLQGQTYRRCTKLILSFLSFPEPTYHSPPPLSLRLQQRQRDEEGAGAGPPTPAEEGPRTPPRTPQRTSAAASPSKLVPSSPAEDMTTPQQLQQDTPARRTAGSELLAPHEAMRLKPLFYVRPQETRSTDLHHLFVRMVHPERLNDEKLNTYFGRYGQTGSAPQQRLTVAEAGLGLPLTQALALQHKSTPEQLLVQDFIITVDTYSNALRAVQQAYYRELLFIALHEPELNAFTLADLDYLVEREGTVYRGELRTLAAPPAPRREKDAQKRAREGSSDSSSSYSSSTDEDEGDGFVPDVLIDGLPYWMLEEDIKTLIQPYGTLISLRVSESDHSGAFTGAVLAQLATVEEALLLTQGVHGMVYQGHRLLCGVLNERMEVVSLKEEEVLQAAPEECSGARGEYFAVGQNERLWV